MRALATTAAVGVLMLGGAALPALAGPLGDAGGVAFSGTPGGGGGGTNSPDSSGNPGGGGGGTNSEPQPSEGPQEPPKPADKPDSGA